MLDILEPELDERRIQTLYRQSNVALSGSFAVGVILAIPFVVRGKYGFVLPWLCLVSISLLVRYWNVRLFLRRPDERRDLRSWLIRHITGVVISGGLWGVLGVYTLYTQPVVEAVVTMVVLTGLCAGAIGNMGFYAPAYFAFAVPCLLPPAVVMLMSGKPVLQVLGLLFGLYLWMTRKATRQLGEIMDMSIRFGYENRNLADELHRALKEVKTLSELIPICASCKKVRDDKGFWNQIEAYLAKHADARFTHGICPDCARDYYRRELNKTIPPQE